MKSYFIDQGVLYKEFVPHAGWPFLIAILAAALFAAIGIRSRGSLVLWALSGGVFAFGTAAIISGLADASAVPYTDRVLHHHQTTALILSVVIIGIAAFLLAVSAWPELQFWRNRPQTQVPGSK